MCGIAGWLGRPDVESSALLADEMLARLKHRGPDARDYRLWPGGALLHARLKIIDLSPLGNQPMSNEDGSVWVIFNGEVYNHHELRSRLESQGHMIQGRSDTAVIPHLYEQLGERFAEQLEGMFTVAVYDLNQQRLVLVRDRFGIKPLYYAQTENALAFASELNSLRAFPGINQEPDRQAIYDYASLLYVPGPRTFFQGIKSLAPGEVLTASWGSAGLTKRIESYHQWSIDINPSWTLEEASQKASEIITRAVRSQMESDVPMGAFLSGGIDSSLVCAAAAQASPGLRTYNARFADAHYDETWAAQAVAQHIGSIHEILDVPPQGGTWEHITGLLLHAGQPFADTSLFPSQAVCQQMRKHVTVALSGDGGDEGFGGYDAFRWCRKIARLQAWPRVSAQVGTTAKVLSRWGFVPQRLAQRWEQVRKADGPDVLQQLMCWIRPQEHAQLCLDNDLEPVRRHFEPVWENHLPAKAGRVERLSSLCSEVHARLVLPYDFLFKVDIASMRESLEVRVPLLDEQVFKIGMTLPDRLKIRKGQAKAVLRSIAGKVLPQAVASKAKAGFSIPLDQWVNAEFRTRFRETLLDKQARVQGYLRPEVYRPIVEAFVNNQPHPQISRAGLYQRAIMLLALELHLRSAAS